MLYGAFYWNGWLIFSLVCFAETKWKKDAPSPMEIDQICDVDNNYEDPQLCATLASDIYMHLREAEVIHSWLNLISLKTFPLSTLL